MSRFNKEYDRQFNKRSKRLEARATRLLNKRNEKAGARKKRKRLKEKLAKVFVRPKYSTYMKSAAWRKRRIAFYQKFGKKCVICGDTSINLHHVTYKNLGREHDDDLIALCTLHHERLHELVTTKHDMKEETYQFIADEIELNEMNNLAKNL